MEIRLSMEETVELCALLDKGVDQVLCNAGSEKQAHLLLTSQGQHSLTNNYYGRSAVGAQRIFHIGWVCFLKQVCIVLKPWYKAIRKQIEIDSHTTGYSNQDTKNEWDRFGRWGPEREGWLL